jgi:hypothetical protein
MTSITVFDYSVSQKRIVRISSPDEHLKGCIKIVKFNDLWKQSKKHKKTRQQWINTNMHVMGIEGWDFFICHEDTSLRTTGAGRPNKYYFCTVAFSKAICVVFKTIPARNIRLYLEKNYKDEWVIENTR